MRSLELAVDGRGFANRRVSGLELPPQFSAFALGGLAIPHRLLEPRLGVSGELVRGMRRQFLIVLRLRECQRPRVGVTPNGVELETDAIELPSEGVEIVASAVALANSLFEPRFC